MKNKPEPVKRNIPPPPEYPDPIHFRVLKDGNTYHVEVSRKHAERPAPYNVVTIGMLHGGEVRLK